jgi:hypothetical protein
MTKTVLALAALAAIGFSGAAFAAEATTGTWTTSTGPAAMSDAEMDRVTAGATPDPTGQGINTVDSAGGLGGQFGKPPGTTPSGVHPGFGKCTAGFTGLNCF